MTKLRRRMINDAEQLLIDAKEMRERIALERPWRLPLAQQIMDDTIRAYSLLEAPGRLTLARRREIAARLVRACIQSEALNHETQ